MACSTCFSNPCSCFQVSTCPSCEDPGMDTTGKHLMVLDAQFCQRRLQNPSSLGGFLWASPNGMTFSNAPLVQLGSVEVDEGDLFGDLIINRANGLFQKVVPADGVDGVLKADGSGRLSFVDISSSFTIPDPLTVTEINVSTLNVDDIVLSGTLTASGLNDDTIVSNIGLNASNQLVKGSSPTISVASFFETNDLAGDSHPNFQFPASPTADVQVAVQISDPDNIATAIGLTTVRIDVPGDYIISWRGNFIGYNPSVAGVGNIFQPGLWLKINSQIVDKGSVSVYQDRHVGGWVGGEYQALGLTAGTDITIGGNGGLRSGAGSENGTGLLGVGIILKKYN